MRIIEFLGWKTDCDIRILTFWLFEGARRYFDAKYDVRYHKIVQNVIQMMLECQQMIELSWKFVWIHIFTRGTRWWCQNSNILTYWKLRRDYDVKCDVRYQKTAQKFIQMMLECQQMIELSWKCIRLHIFIRGTRWWCQNSNILTYWRLRRIVTSDSIYLTSQAGLTLQKVKWLEFQYHSDSRVKLFDHANV